MSELIYHRSPQAAVPLALTILHRAIYQNTDPLTACQEAAAVLEHTAPGGNR